MYTPRHLVRRRSLESISRKETGANQQVQFVQQPTRTRKITKAPCLVKTMVCLCVCVCENKKLCQLIAPPTLVTAL